MKAETVEIPAERDSQAFSGRGIGVTPIISDFFGSAVVPTASVGVPPAESSSQLAPPFL
jgi:hypothetical protein